MDLSIIIPAFNAETYIKNCLSSLLNQQLDFDRFEVLVVNDGSTDNTEELVKEVSKELSNFKVINQDNKGNGAARNTGIDAAKGQYIYFLDADDYVAHNTLDKLLDIAMENDLDVLGFKSKQVTDGLLVQSENLKMDRPISIINGREYIANNNYKPEVWWYFTKRSFFLSTKVRFYDRKFVQDSFITPSLFTKAEKIAYVDHDTHRYFQSPNSITRDKTGEHLKVHLRDIAFAVKKLDDLIQSIVAENALENEKCLNTLKAKKESYVFVSIIRYIRSSLPYSNLLEGLEGFRKHEAYPLAHFLNITSYNTRINRLLVFIFNSRPLLYLSFRSYRFAKKFKGK